MKKINLLIVLVFLGSFAFSLTASEEKLEAAEQFISKLRASHPVGTWGVLKGDVVHKRRTAERNKKGFFSSPYENDKAEIKVGTLFTKLQVVAEIQLTDNSNEGEKEIYKVGQTYNGDAPTVITSNLKDESLIGNFGISPGDFTMAFLYWDEQNVDQDKITSVKTLKCRVINLINERTKEKVKVFASVEYYYPLKVQWFKPAEVKPYRTMVIDSFSHDGELGAPSEISIYGPGWKTRIDFDDVRLGYSKDGRPKDLFN